MKYYVWATYYFAPILKQLSSDEICYYDGHRHGVQPSAREKQDCIDDLERVVENAANDRNVAVPTDVQQMAQIKTRSEH